MLIIELWYCIFFSILEWNDDAIKILEEWFWHLQFIFFIQQSGTSILDVYIQFAVFQQSDQEIKRWYKVGESQPKYFFFGL